MFNFFNKQTQATQEQQNEPQREMSPDELRQNQILRNESVLNDALAKTFPVRALNVVTGTGKDSAELENNTRELYTYASAFSVDQLSWFANKSFPGYQAIITMSQDWLIDKACRVPAEDATRNGWDLSAVDEVGQQHIDTILKFDKKMGVKQKATEFAYFCRVFGVRIAFYDCGLDDEALKQPFNIDAVRPKSYRGMVQVDPIWVAPILEGDEAYNPLSQHYYEPTYWQVAGKQIHRSHFVVVRHKDVPDLLKPSYLFGGISVTQMIAESVYGAQRTSNEAPALAMTKRLNVLKTDMSTFYLNPSASFDKMSKLNEVRDNFGVRLIDSDDEMQQLDTTLTGFDDVTMLMYQLVAAASNVPATKLLNTTPKGFNATGEYEAKSYAQMVAAIQENQILPFLERHYEILTKSLRLDVMVNVEFKPTDEPTQKEIAELNAIKANTDKTYADVGAIDGAVIRDRLRSDARSGYNLADDVDDGGMAEIEALLNGNIANQS